jgi:hypothetical protein
LAGLRIGADAVLRAAPIPWTSCWGAHALTPAHGPQHAQPHGGPLLGRPRRCTLVRLARADLRPQVAELRTLLGRQYAPRTANNYLSALKAVLRESKRLGLLDPATFDT